MYEGSLGQYTSLSYPKIPQLNISIVDFEAGTNPDGIYILLPNNSDAYVVEKVTTVNTGVFYNSSVSVVSVESSLKSYNVSNLVPSVTPIFRDLTKPIGLKKFDISELYQRAMDTGAIVLLCGLRGSGKTTFAKNIMENFQVTSDSMHIFIGTGRYDINYAKYGVAGDAKNESAIYDKLQNLPLNTDTEKVRTIVFDDPLCETEQSKMDLVQVVKNLRQRGTLIIVMTQQYWRLLLGLQQCTDYMMVAPTNSSEHRQKIYMMNRSIFDTYNTFDKYISEISGYNFMVMNQYMPRSVEESVFYCNTRPYWEFHAAH